MIAEGTQPFGWEYAVDIQWFEPAATGFDYR